MSFFGRLFGTSGAKESSEKKPASPKPPDAHPERKVRIVRLTRETADATTVTLSLADGGPIGHHEPGQFMMLRFDLPTGAVWRAYSICTPPDANELSVTVKRIAGGLVSTHVVERAAEDDVLVARGPMGRFIPPTNAKRLFLIAGGSGITPMMSQIRHRLAQPEPHELTLLYGNRGAADVIFRAQLAELATQHPQLRVQHVLSTGADELGAAPGMLDEVTVAQHLRRLAPAPSEYDAYLVCGPEPMMAAARAALLAHGVGESAILEERFNAATTASFVDAAKTAIELTFTHEGGVDHVTVEPGETLLEAAQRKNLPLDFSCMAGQCGTCMVKLDAGDVRMEEPHCLTAAEQKSGHILACVSHPRGPVSISAVKPKY